MMFKRSLLSVAVMTAVISSPNTHAFDSSPFFEDGNVSGGIYNFTRVRNRKDLEDGKYKENIHHSTALANVEFNSGLVGGFFGIDVGAFGTYDMWNSGSSYDSEFSLRDEKKGKVVNTVSVYKASARLDFDTLQLRAGYLQPSGPGVLGVNWSFVPGTYGVMRLDTPAVALTLLISGPMSTRVLGKSTLRICSGKTEQQ